MIAGLHFADISEYQGRPDWRAYGAARPIVICRSSFGAGRPDNSIGHNLAGARAHVRLRGWYQFMRADQDAVQQAEYHASLVGPGWSPGDFNMLDWEDYPDTGGWPLQSQAEAWCRRVDELLGGVAWVYSNAWHSIPGRPKITASYGWDWPTAGEVAWQHTDGQEADTECQPAPGFPACDCNVTTLTPMDLAVVVGAENARHVEEDDTMRMLTCPRPDGSGDDMFYVMPDGHLRHFRMAGPWTEGHKEGHTDPPGTWVGLTYAGYTGGDVYVKGVGVDGAIWAIRWVAGGAGWEGAWPD